MSTAGVVANVRVPHGFLRMGALCWVVGINPGNDSARIEVKGMSRGGRIVTTWIDSRDLRNFRCKIDYSRRDAPHYRLPYDFLTKEAASMWASKMNAAFGNKIREHLFTRKAEA